MRITSILSLALVIVFRPCAAVQLPQSCFSQPIAAWYDGSGLTTSQWTDKSGNGFHASFTNTVPLLFGGADASNEYYLNGEPVLYGDTSTVVVFPDNLIVGKEHTVFNACKYKEGGTEGRILQSRTVNALFGFWNGYSGVAYENGWMTSLVDTFGAEWLLSSQTNQLYRGNGNDLTIASGKADAIGKLGIGIGTSGLGVLNINTDWACAEILIINAELSEDEVECVENTYFNCKYADGFGVTVADGVCDLYVQGSSDSPTGSPTAPTDQPTASPTTSSPTTSEPTTSEPTTMPSADPSASPTTPAPTHPGEITCGSSKSGDYSGNSVEFEVRMPFAGDLTIDASGSDFEVTDVSCYNVERGVLTAAANTLTMKDLPATTDYDCTIGGGDGISSGTFHIVIACESDAPTSSPATASPTTSAPTTAEPTTSAPTTDEPTSNPTRADTICYNDEECRGKEVCDMDSFICVNPTPSPVTPSPTDAAGCCYGESYKASGKCAVAMEAGKCAEKGCQWMATDDAADCEMTTTKTVTTETEVGCCKGDSAKSNSICNARDSQETCDRSSSCHWMAGGDVSVDCVVEETTITPGCCFGNPNAAYSKRWMESCTSYFTGRECLMLTDDEGSYRCAWEDLSEGYDCAQLWPTTTTTTAVPGCCRGMSAKTQAKCVGLPDMESCKRKDCEWVHTHNYDDCLVESTTTAPGCCAGDSKSATEKCSVFDDDAAKCDGRSTCHFLVGEDADCAWTETEAPEEPGCCYGNPSAAYSAKWMERCVTYYTARECQLLTSDEGDNRCYWEATDDSAYDCSQLWPTTTTTTVAPGCCRGSSYKAQAKCYGVADQIGCERKSCEWIETADAMDCVITTSSTTTPPTTTADPGCCKGDSKGSTEKCNAIGDNGMCDTRAACHWVAFGELATDCAYEPTEVPEEPGCCYGNPDAAYSKRWMESCTAFFTERDCLLLTNGDSGDARCAWEPTNDDMYDCSQLWPTTTTKKAEPGCCAGITKSANDACGLKESADSCNRMSKCMWDAGEDADCAWPTTTSEPWLGAKGERRSKSMRSKSNSHRNAEQKMASDVSIGEQIQSTTVSLSTLLFVVAAAFVVYQMYQFRAAASHKKKVALTEGAQNGYYQAV